MTPWASVSVETRCCPPRSNALLGAPPPQQPTGARHRGLPYRDLAQQTKRLVGRHGRAKLPERSQGGEPMRRPDVASSRRTLEGGNGPLGEGVE